MNRHSGLLTRLRRLEARRKAPKPLATIIMGIYADEAPGRVLGIEGGGTFLPALAGEALPELQRRAVAALPFRILGIRYSAPTARQSAVPAPTAAPAPVAAPFDPWALAGIGRRATQAELERMGATWLPPERIV